MHTVQSSLEKCSGVRRQEEEGEEAKGAERARRKEATLKHRGCWGQSVLDQLSWRSCGLFSKDI